MAKDEIADVTRLALGDCIRAAVKAVLEQVIEEEMTEHIGAKYREKWTAARVNATAHTAVTSLTPVGKIEQLRVPRDRDGTFTRRGNPNPHKHRRDRRRGGYTPPLNLSHMTWMQDKAI